MTLYNRYLLALTLSFIGTAVAFALAKQQQVGLYFSLYLVEYLIVTLFFAYLHPRARHTLTVMGYILFLGFLLIVSLRVAQVLGLMGDGT